MNAREVAEEARVNRSFVYDIMRGRSGHPNLEKLDKVAAAIRVERNWLLHGKGEVEGDAPEFDEEIDAFVAIPSVEVTASMGGGRFVADEVENGEPYHFRSSWITHRLRADPANLRILHVEGDSMIPTLQDGDVVLVDLSRCIPTPPGIFVLFDGMGLVAKRLEHIPNSDPPQVRIISDNPFYSPYERTAEEIRIIGRIRWFGREI
jgi:phage repressor protein C with HTH and peptisase S24 domain